MKRIWFGAGLLAGLLVLGIISNSFMERTHHPQADKLSRAAKLAADGDWAAARNLYEDAKQTWDEKQLLIAALCRHEPVDRINGLFAQLEVYSETRSVTSFCSTCVDLASQLESIGKSHKLNLHNFF